MDAVLNIDVPDLDAAILFYANAIGLSLHRRLFENTAAEMRGGPLPIYLLLKEAASSPGAAVPGTRHYARHWTPLHLDFVVSDIDMAVQRAIAAGAVLETAVSEFAWGKLAVFSDPFGHGFCFVEWSARGYDAAA